MLHEAVVAFSLDLTLLLAACRFDFLQRSQEGQVSKVFEKIAIRPRRSLMGVMRCNRVRRPDSTYLHKLSQIGHEQVQQRRPVVGGRVLGQQRVVVDFREGAAGRARLVRRVKEGDLVGRVLLAIVVLGHELPIEGLSVELLRCRWMG